MKALVAALLAAMAVCAAAQPFPSKAVRIVSSFPSGISPDVSARVVGERLARRWNQPVLVEPRPGANGYLAIGAVKKAHPDGHELLLVSNAHMTINPTLLRDVPYDAERDFVPVSLLYRAPFFVFVSSSGPYRSVGDIVAAAKASPERVSYSTPYVGSPPHLGGAKLAHASGTAMLAVHIKDGAQIYTSVANREISFTLATKGSATPLMKAGKLTMLAAASAARLPSDPEVPTIRESGGPDGVELNSWVGLFAPSGTPAEVVRKLGEDIALALADPEVQERYRALGLDPAPVATTELAALIRMDLARNREVIRRVGLSPE